MSYKVVIRPSAERDMKALPRKVFDRACSAILTLEINPRSTQSKKLTGTDAYRLRVGDHRVLYTISDTKKMVDVYSVGHRKDIYR